MLVSVLSPHCRNNGNTITSIFTALGLADLKKTTILTHTSSKSDVFYTYLGLHSFEDKTNTPTQLVKLMRDEAIKIEDIGDYCKTITDGCDVFTNNLKTFTEEDMYTLMDRLTSANKYDYMIVDIDEDDLSKDIPKMVIERSDIIMINLTQSALEISKFNKEKDKYMKLFHGKKIILVCNMFSQTAWASKDFLKKIGVKTSVSVVHYNNWIRWGCNTGKLLDVYKFVKLKDARVIELGSDIFNLAGAVNKARLAIIRANKDKGGADK